MTKKIWLLQNNTVKGYDTYDSCIVVAKTKAKARLINPNNSDWGDMFSNSWCAKPKDVVVTLVGYTDTQDDGVLLASFNAG